MRDINDYFEGESYPAGQFGHMLDVVPLEDAKRIAVEYAEQFKPKWISVAEKLPENNTHHAVLINGDRNTSYQLLYTGGYDAIFEEWINPFGDKIEEKVTHWMPIVF